MSGYIETPMLIESEGGKVILTPEDDTALRRTFDDWDQVNAYIAKFREVATATFGTDTSDRDE